MEISLLSEPSTDSQWDGWHVLTVAESGFSMLDIYGRKRLGVDGEKLRAFEEKINSTGESGSLFPFAPLSAVPRKFFREESASRNPVFFSDFQRHIQDFISANETIIRAEKVLIEFHVSSKPVPTRYVRITEQAFRGHGSSNVLKQVVIAV